jgi:hypothetical protein
VRAAIAIAVASCSCWTQSARTPARHLERVERRHPPVLVGRVTLDGKPVRFYGVTLEQWRDYLPTVEVSNAHGRFEISDVSTGSWDVIIAGPGFARRIIVHQRIDSEKVLDLGQIEVERGSVVDGHITDAQGAPMPHATVAIMQSVSCCDPKDELTMLARGWFETTTDANGAYAIDGFIRLDDTYPWIFARSDGQLSFPIMLSNRSATIDLVVVPTGRVEGTVNGPLHGSDIVGASPIGVPNVAPRSPCEPRSPPEHPSTSRSQRRPDPSPLFDPPKQAKHQ